jgi:hypothetical protein
VIEIDWKSFLRDVNRWIDGKVRQTKAGAVVATMDAASIVNSEIRNSIREANAIASGDLLESVTVSSMRASTDMVEVTVGSSSPYASIVEEGRRAGAKAPPVESILDWMVMKGLEPDARGAYLIARKISRDGIPAKKVFEKGVNKARFRIDSRLDAIMEDSLRKD